MRQERLSGGLRLERVGCRGARRALGVSSAQGGMQLACCQRPGSWDHLSSWLPLPGLLWVLTPTPGVC